MKGSDGTEYKESYDKLLLSPGATPVRPPLPGIDNEGIFTLRNVEDTDRIKQYLQTLPVKRAVIVGGGFIGLEMAENLHHAGAEVAIVEMANQVMAPMDYSMAAFVHQHLLQKAVKLYLGQAVASFSRRRTPSRYTSNPASSSRQTSCCSPLAFGQRPGWPWSQV